MFVATNLPATSLNLFLPSISHGKEIRYELEATSLISQHLKGSACLRAPYAGTRPDPVPGLRAVAVLNLSLICG